mmetsp:Transcript_21301/g.48958  ORF Transcript_21301/g.48958 Transcript_21301/m.48958 type:complete len:352 (-) Transcript_21301:159-1214(-)
MPDPLWLQVIEKHGLTREEMKRRVAKQMNKRMEAARTMPELFKPLDMPNHAPAIRAIEDRRTGGQAINATAVSRQAGPVMSFATPPPDHSQDIAVGIKHGLVDKGGGNWFCPVCEMGLTIGRLTDHVCSKAHSQWLDSVNNTEMLLQRHQNGVAPPYIRLVLDDNGRSSHEVCLLCRKEATESHMYSDKHRKKEDLFKFGGISIQDIENWDQQGKLYSAFAPAPAAPAIQNSDAFCGSLVPAVVHHGEPPLPPHFGQREWYEWRTERGSGWWYCRLCWKYADDSHIVSDNHRRRSACPESYLACCPVVQPCMDMPQLAAPTTYLAPPPPPPNGPPPPLQPAITSASDDLHL